MAVEIWGEVNEMHYEYWKWDWKKKTYVLSRVLTVEEAETEKKARYEKRKRNRANQLKRE